MVPRIPVPVVLGGGWQRHLWSVNGEPNGVYEYDYCANLCLSRDVHCGHDVEANFEPIYAATDGVVKFAGDDSYYTPYHVDIEPTVGPFRGEYHIYGHLSDYWVGQGQQVTRGQRIGTTGTAGTGPHVHWERRTPDNACGYGYRSTDPTLVLSSPNANVDGGGGGAGFERYDKIEVADGPVRLREGPGTSFPVLEELPTGVQLCVTGEPQSADGYSWSPARVLNTNRPGWLATTYCAMVDAQACLDTPFGVPSPGGVFEAAGVTEAFTPHPDTGMTPEEFAARLESAPKVDYDEDGNFVGVTFPAIAVPEGVAPDDRFWVKG